MSDPAESVQRLLRAAGETVATAESLTGGRLAALLTGIPGASDVYVGGVVTYATELKASLLGVPDRIIEEHGVVSSECAQAMATGVRALTGATYGVATTGVAGPAEQEGKPAGTVFVGIAGPDLVAAVALELRGKRGQIQDRTCREALSAFEQVLRREETPLG
ncbi:damage-inducible protein CinA [Nocardioides sp. Root1257]|uniref:CinA family protein n=1 Tax=unclassified Nocardioides TaxID=2615069 RepID=UPI0006FD04DA|nr:MULTISPECIES: CinA family protein [unclassified Nocardioides]KQW43880.1 damage-inducible protein CinA [Nocardioides sp. Root1257]KRC42321.1 damage-inducible protein CinA [Nocardioides sp. Root224]